MSTENLLSWLTSPSDTLATSLEIICDVILGVCTLATLVAIGLDYAAEHLDWSWGEKRKHIFAVGVMIGLVGELLFESGSFWYSYLLQASQDKQIVALAGTAQTAQSSAQTALSDAGNAASAASLAQDRASAASAAIDDLDRREMTLREALQKETENLAPRSLSKEQFEDIRALKGIIASVNIIPGNSSTEDALFTMQLINAFNNSGIKAIGAFGISPLTASGVNVFVFIPTGQREKYKPLIDALKKAEIYGGLTDFNPTVTYSVPTDIPLLIVGEKVQRWIRSPYDGSMSPKN